MFPADDSGGMGWHDEFGNPFSKDYVEQHGPVESFEDESIFELDFTELLKSLPELQRLAITKRMDGVPLDDPERKALQRAKPLVTKWLEFRSQ